MRRRLTPRLENRQSRHRLLGNGGEAMMRRDSCVFQLIIQQSRGSFQRNKPMKKHVYLPMLLTILLALSLDKIVVVSAFGDKRMTIEDALAIKQIGAPQLSP